MKQEHIDIETPEKIIFSYTISSTGARIVSYSIDAFIQILFILILYLIVYANQGFNFSGSSHGLFTELSGLFAAFAFLLYFLVQWGYFIFFEVITEGQSPGKKLMKIRVIKTNGESLDFATIILRNLLRAVDAFPVYHLLGGIVSIADSKSRRLGDIVSDTIVVREIAFNLKEPDFITLFRASSAQSAFTLYNKRLNEEELYILRRFLNENSKLSTIKQHEIAFRLAQKIKKQLHIQGEIDNPMTFIERIYRGHTDEDKK